MKDCVCHVMSSNEAEQRPEDYIPIGSRSFIYINAYNVTSRLAKNGDVLSNDRHEPLASIPVQAISIKSDSIRGYELKAENEEQIEMFKTHLHNLFDNSGLNICIRVEDHEAQVFPRIC